MKRLLAVVAMIMASSMFTQAFTPINTASVTKAPSFNYTRFMSSLWVKPLPVIAKNNRALVTSYIDVLNECGSGVTVTVVAAGYLFNPIHNQTGSWPNNGCIEDFCDTDVSGLQSIFVYIDWWQGNTASIKVTDYQGNIQCQDITGNGWYQFDNVYIQADDVTHVWVTGSAC